MFLKCLSIAAVLISLGALNTRADDWTTPDAAFAVNVYVTVTPSVATVQVYNSFPGPVRCFGSVTAITYSGIPLTENFVMQAVDMQTYGYAYVYTTNPYDPFINGWGQGWCQLLPVE